MPLAQTVMCRNVAAASAAAPRFTAIAADAPSRLPTGPRRNSPARGLRAHEERIGLQREREAPCTPGPQQVRAAAGSRQLHGVVRALPRTVPRQRHAALPRPHHRPERQPLARPQPRIGRDKRQPALNVVIDARLPESAEIGLEREWSRLWKEFRHDVNVATSSLICLLELIHGKYLAERQRLVHAMQANNGKLRTLDDAVRAIGDVGFVPVYPRLRAFPSLSGEPFFVRTAPDGPMEQTVLRGWVYEVWDLWESRFRTQLKHEKDTAAMRIQVLSDLHLEFGGTGVPPLAPGADIVVPAGDFAPAKRRSASLMGRAWKEARHILNVPGNHEYYGSNIADAQHRPALDCAGCGVTLLDTEAVTIGDMRFVGATLWTDFRLHGQAREADAHHAADRAFIKAELAQAAKDGLETVMITHHAPSRRSIHPRFARDPLPPGYAPHLEVIIVRFRPALWVHGHVHQAVDFRIGRTRALANPRGYDKAEAVDFVPDLVVEV